MLFCPSLMVIMTMVVVKIRDKIIFTINSNNTVARFRPISPLTVYMVYECPLKQMIQKSPGLKNLNISCNPLKVDGSMKILEGIKKSPRILRVDMRLTECSRDIDLAIQETLRKNRFANKKAPTFSASSRSSSPSLHTQTQTQRTPKSSTSKKYPYPKH